MHFNLEANVWQNDDGVSYQFQLGLFWSPLHDTQRHSTTLACTAPMFNQGAPIGWLTPTLP